MLEAILEVIGEFLLQVLLEILADLGFHILAEPFRKTPNPVIAALGYLLLGAIAGYLSVWLVSSHFTPSSWRIANLVFTPLAVGAFMLLLGSWRSKQGFAVLRIERFAYGYLFALGVALVRFHLTK